MGRAARRRHELAAQRQRLDGRTMTLLLLPPPTVAGGGGGPPPPPATSDTALVSPLGRPPDRLPVIAAAPVTVRHITRDAAGAVTVVGAQFTAQPGKGLNGRRGYSSGSYESALSEEGRGTLVLPNSVGEDGILHRRRFLCLTDPAYHAGDEWIEVWQDGRTSPLFVGTPIDWEKRRSQVSLELADAAWMLNTQRETAAGFWAHAPRDVFEHYTKAWVPVVADDFASGADSAKWTTGGGGTTSAQTGAVRVNVNPTGTFASTTLAARADYWGTLDLQAERAWRLEISCALSLSGTTGIGIGLRDSGGTFTRVALRANPLSVGLEATIVPTTSPAVSDATFVRATVDLMQQGLTMAIEARDRWVLFYFNGRLVHSIELDLIDPAVCIPEISVERSGTGSGYVDVKSIVLRRAVPYLMRSTSSGDFRLPGVLPSGGLRGAYYDEADLRSYGDTNAPYYRRALAPTRAPYARRQDTTINFAAATPPTWMPATPPNGEYFTVRWTGAIYLDLAAADVTLRLAQLDNAARLWVGKTMYGDQLINQWGNPAGAPFTLATSSLRAHLGTASGWYPIRIDWAQGAGAGGIVLEQAIGGGAYATVPSTSLSPFGIYEAQVRYDSHAEQLKAIALAYGLQYRCEPRSLESGQFPGEVVPRVRVGRDTDKVLTPDESTEVAVQGSASEVVDTLIADASGLGDQANAAQLTQEILNLEALQPGAHIAIASAYESLADITDPVLLQTRMASMLGLRTTAWEEVAARPRGHRELRDTFPMSGQIASFAWEPGDALRVQDDAIDLNDSTPRQIVAPSWTFNPDGLGAPSVRFRQRPRSQQDALRALVRGVLLPQRNYQGQLAIVNGTYSHLDGGVTRVALPRDLDDIIRCELVVSEKTDSSTWTVQEYPAATSTGVTFTSPGRFDLLAFVKRFGGTSPQMTINAVGGTGSAFYQLELLVRI
jgi:hypothetical protein